MAKEQERKSSDVPTDSVDQDVPERVGPTPPDFIGPGVAGPAVDPLDPATEGPVGQSEPSQGEIALEREVKAARAHPRR